MAITFYKLDAAVATDRELPGPALRLYVLMLSLADIKTRRVAIYIRDIAEKYKRSERTVQRWLSHLCRWGLIQREDHRRKGDPRWNEKTIFTVCGNEAARYNLDANYSTVENQIDTPNQIGTPDDNEVCREASSGGDTQYHRQGVSPSGDTQRHPKDSRENYRDKDSLKGGDGLPRNEKEPIKATSVTSPSQPVASKRTIPNRNLREIYTPDDAPVVLKQTAKYFLHETGRAGLTSDDISALMALNANHSPARIQKEIDTACDRFRRRGQVLTALTFAYIAGSLEHQQSLTKRKGSRSDTVVLGMSQADIDRCSQVKPLTPEEIESFKKQLELDIREGRLV